MPFDLPTGEQVDARGDDRWSSVAVGQSGIGAERRAPCFLRVIVQVPSRSATTDRDMWHAFLRAQGIDLV